ncbi:glycosyltransferase family 2 protein [Seohaeicola saemankumensis]|uniref:Glycosyltransferase family 2 protein n=1 Tax=Seohaeicola saemankumensis TaxID=481181 RepID=A0ABW3TC11_9RHOB
MPRFSIVIPSFNAAATIGGTLQSLQHQSFTDWEAICVDDGSTDATPALVQAAASLDPRISLVRNTGKGPSAARNMGALDCASGQIVAFCDADDMWHADKLSQWDKVFRNDDVDGAYGQVAFFSDTPDDATTFSALPAGQLSIARLLGENPVCTMSNIGLRRSVFVATGGFDREMVHNEDLEWLIRLVGQGAVIVGVPQLQTFYRTSRGGLSTNLQAMEEGRLRALDTAARFGVIPDRRSHAIHQRYLARRALRLGLGPTQPLRHALRGLGYSPSGFLSPARRGALTLAGALAALVLPKGIALTLFSR